MKMTFKLYGYLPSKISKYDKKKGVVIELESHSTLEELISMIPLENSECIAISSNGVVLAKGQIVHSTDVIRLFPISSGG